MFMAMNTLKLCGQLAFNQIILFESCKFFIFPLRKWIDDTELSAIDYVLKSFNESWVKDKIPGQVGRKDLLTPVSKHQFTFLFMIYKVTHQHWGWGRQEKNGEGTKMQKKKKRKSAEQVKIVIFMLKLSNLQGQKFATECENPFRFSQWNSARIHAFSPHNFV